MSLIVALALAAAPPPQSCQAALGPLHGGIEEEALTGRVDGATLASRDALLELRRSRGDALIALIGGSFAGADFSGARLHNICFIETDLGGTVWRGADAGGVGFVRARLGGADLAGARMPFVLLRAPDMAQASAVGADFSQGRLDGGWDGSLDGLVLDRADLRGFRFECGITIMDGCPVDRRLSLRGADLSGASLHSWWFEADYEGARIDRTEVALYQLADLHDAEIAGPVLLRGGDATVALSAAELSEAIAAIVPAAPAADSASFDCGAARTTAERLICGDEGYLLRVYDRELADVYRRALAADRSVDAGQRAWLAERGRCADADCLARSYQARIGQLIGRLGPPAWLRPGATALFVADRIGFGDAFRASPLYRRILPAIVGGAASHVAVRVRDDGTIDVAGDAVGANAHLCSLGGEGLRFDPATGWFSGPYEAQRDDPPEWARRPMPVVRFVDDRLEVYRNGQGGWADDPVDPRPSDYASCGARASFDEMIRVPASREEIESLFDPAAGE